MGWRHSTWGGGKSALNLLEVLCLLDPSICCFGKSLEKEDENEVKRASAVYG